MVDHPADGPVAGAPDLVRIEEREMGLTARLDREKRRPGQAYWQRTGTMVGHEEGGPVRLTPPPRP